MGTICNIIVELRSHERKHSRNGIFVLCPIFYVCSELPTTLSGDVYGRQIEIEAYEKTTLYFSSIQIFSGRYTVLTLFFRFVGYLKYWIMSPLYKMYHLPRSVDRTKEMKDKHNIKFQIKRGEIHLTSAWTDLKRAAKD